MTADIPAPERCAGRSKPLAQTWRSPTPLRPVPGTASRVLIIVSLFGVLDRQVFILHGRADPGERSSLSDLPARACCRASGVSLFAAIVGYPIGWLADRYDRRVVLACCIVVVVIVGRGLRAGRRVHGAVRRQRDGGRRRGRHHAVHVLAHSGVVPQQQAPVGELAQHGRRRLGTGAAIAFCGLLSQLAEVSRPYLPVAMQGMETWRLTFFWAALPAPLFVLLLLWLPVHVALPPCPMALPLAATRFGQPASASEVSGASMAGAWA